MTKWPVLAATPLLLVVILALAGCGRATPSRVTPSSSGSSSTSVGSTGVGPVVGSIPISPSESPLFVPWQGSLFVIEGSSDSPDSFSAVRVTAAGDVTKTVVAFPLAIYLMSLSAGSDGIYAGTSVIKRFTNQPDELLRIDPQRLTISARASFPASVIPLAVAANLWVSVGDGRVLKLDPDTLAVLSSRQILAPTAVPSSGAVLSKPALGLGSLWVLAGDESDLELVRLDPATLVIRSRTKVPTAGSLHQAIYRVVADSGHVYVVGSAVVGVDENGKLMGPPVVVPGLENAEIAGQGLVGPAVEGGQAALLHLDSHGNIVARTALRDIGAQLEVSGNDIWFVGNAGQGEGIVHMRLVGG